MKLFIIVILLFVMGACVPVKNTTSPVEAMATELAASSAAAVVAQEDSSSQYITLSGIIIAHVQAGGDGDVWLLQTADGTRYAVLLSIPNLGRTYSQALADVKVGAQIEVSGEILRLQQLEHMVARTLLVW